MDEALNAMNTEEFGALKRMSPPTPAMRCPLSFMMPVVKPTINRMSITSRATARMLTSVRTGLAKRLAVMICLFKYGLSLIKAWGLDYLPERVRNLPDVRAGTHLR